MRISNAGVWIMVKIKWFSGGNDRSYRAVKLIVDILNELDKDSNSQNLKNALVSYKNELVGHKQSVPFILSRMNVDIANCIRKDHLSLTISESEKLKELGSLSNIRYGY